MEQYDLIMVGGGASGMVAAITAARENPSARILILERKEQLGKKLLATGNGRCNLTNLQCETHGDTLDFFQDLGILTRSEEGGRVYPYTEQAADVVWALAHALEQKNIAVWTNTELLGIEPETGGFLLTCKDTRKKKQANKQVRGRKVLLAMGGKAGPAFGTIGDGAKFARKLGHHVTRLAPALTAVETVEDLQDLAGLRCKGRVSLFRQEECIRSEMGEVQFTRYGLSGICIFNLSRYLVIPEGKGLADGFSDYRIQIDFLPEESEVETLLCQRKESLGEDFLRGMVPRALAQRMVQETDGDLAKIALCLKGYTFHVAGTKGWDFAQVTRGGVALDEVDEETMESKCCPGIFLAGEILDYDGPCGGFNLEHAWVTGIKAGKGMVR